MLSPRMHLSALRALCACTSLQYALLSVACTSFISTDFHLSRGQIAICTRSYPWSRGLGILASRYISRSRRRTPSLLYISSLQASSAEPSLSGADGSPPPPTGQQSSHSLRSMWSHDSGVTWAIHLRGTRDIPLLTPALLQFCVSHSCLCLHSPKVGTLQTFKAYTDLH